MVGPSRVTHPLMPTPAVCGARAVHAGARVHRGPRRAAQTTAQVPVAELRKAKGSVRVRVQAYAVRGAISEKRRRIARTEALATGNPLLLCHGDHQSVQRRRICSEALLSSQCRAPPERRDLSKPSGS